MTYSSLEHWRGIFYKKKLLKKYMFCSRVRHWAITGITVSCLPILTVTGFTNVLSLSFDAEVNFCLVKFWKNQVVFTTRLVQKQSFVFFVTAGIRFFSVSLTDQLTAVRSLPLSNSSVSCLFHSFHKAFGSFECCCHLTGLDRWNLWWRSYFSAIDTHFR